MKRTSIRVNRPGGTGGRSSFNIFDGADGRFPETGYSVRSSARASPSSSIVKRGQLLTAPGKVSDFSSQRYSEDANTYQHVQFTNEENRGGGGGRVGLNAHGRGGMSVTGATYSVKVARAPGGGSSFSPFAHDGQPEYGGRWGQSSQIHRRDNHAQSQPVRVAPSNFMQSQKNRTSSLLKKRDEAARLQTSSIRTSTLGSVDQHALPRSPSSSMRSKITSYSYPSRCGGIENQGYDLNINERNNCGQEYRIQPSSATPLAKPPPTPSPETSVATSSASVLSTKTSFLSSEGSFESDEERYSRLQSQLSVTPIEGMEGRENGGVTGHERRFVQQWNNHVDTTTIQGKRTNGAVGSDDLPTRSHYPAQRSTAGSGAAATGASQCIRINTNQGKYKSRIQFG